jgi:hypothetical protein
MKEKIFTLCFCLILGMGSLTAQLNTGTGTGWGIDLFPGEPLLLDENFQGFAFFHSDSTPDMGNSNNTLDPVTQEVVYGYTNFSTNVLVLGTEDSAITYEFYQCAFAPEWQTAYAFKEQGENTPNVSNGFVEVSRDYGSTPPTVHGHFIVDLRNIDFVEMIQWSHSSCGGNKRGVMLEFSVDDGTTWDTLRYQPGGAGYTEGFTKDVFTGEKTGNGYRCDPSAYGMLWEDAIYSENMMLRFGEAGGQVPRIHDLKVYGTYTASSKKEIPDNDLKIYCVNKTIRISEMADVEVYSLVGKRVKMAQQVNSLAMDDMPQGIYIVKAKGPSAVKTTKVVVK